MAAAASTRSVGRREWSERVVARSVPRSKLASRSRERGAGVVCWGVMTASHQSSSGSAIPRIGVDLESIWRDHADAVLRYATVLVGPDDAHDITTDVFVRISQSPGWGQIENPRAYLVRAVTNRANDVRRQQDRRARRELTTFDFGTAPIVEPAVDLRRQIAALSLQQRAVVFFTYWEDMTIPAIADLLGLSSGTVHRNLTRARAQLRKALQ